MDSGSDAAARMRTMVNGYQVSHALSVAAALGLSDLLADGPRTVAELASATGSDASALLRLLRALATVGVYQPVGDGRFAGTELGDQLRAEPPPGGADAVAASYDFSGFGTVVDVGGGTGGLLAAVLERSPGVRGILFDQPTVVPGARDLLAARGLVDRCEVVGGDFFSGVPGGGDAYLLKSVLHNWTDEDAVAILRACRSAMADGGAVLLVERLLGEGPDPGGTAFMDLNMLVGPGGREPNRAEYATLLDAADLRLERATPTSTDAFVLEARPVR